MHATAGQLTPAASASLVKFGYRTRPVETTPSATTTVARLVPNNPDRIEFTVMNLGTDYIAIGLLPSLAYATGIQIPPQGGAIVLLDEDGEAVAYEWYVIAFSGSQQLYLQEVIV